MEQVQLRSPGLLDLHYQIRFAVKAGRVFQNDRACTFVMVVRKAAVLARTCLQQHLVSQAHQIAACLRNERDAGLQGLGFAWYADAHESTRFGSFCRLLAG